MNDSELLNAGIPEKPKKLFHYLDETDTVESLITIHNIDKILAERDSRYGSFDSHAEISQQLKLVIRCALEKRQKILEDDQYEALDMICHKIGRIINGDPDYSDSWIDIAGYAKLVADRLESEKD